MEPQQQTTPLLQRAYQLSPELHHAFQEALKLLQEGELETALDHSRRLLCLNENAPLFWILEGRIRLACEEWTAAKRSFYRACDLAPQDPVALLERANFDNLLGEHDQAVRWSQAALALPCSHLEQRDAYMILAEALFALIQTRMAHLLEEQVDQGNDVAESSVPSDEWISQWMREGTQAISQALSIDRQSPDAWAMQANFATLARQTKEAAAAWREAHRLQPNDPHYMHELALTLEELRDFVGAHELYRKLYEYSSFHQEETTFLFDEFANMVGQAWQEVSEEMLPSLDVSLPFIVVAEDFPPKGMLEEAPRDAPFDPWIGTSMRVVLDQGAPTVRIALYQRNVERDAATDDPQQLYLHIYDLIEDTLLYLDSLMNEDETTPLS